MRAALDGLPGAASAEVDLGMGIATVRAGFGLTDEEAVEAVQDKVFLPWARGLLARTPSLARRRR